MSQPKNTENGCHGDQSVPFDQALDKLREKFYSRLFIQEENGFQNGGTMCPLAPGAPKKPGLNRVKATDAVFCCQQQMTSNL